MLQAYRVTSGKPSATYKDLHEHLGAPKSCVPESAAGALGESRWWLHGVAKAGERSRPAVFDAYPSLGRARPRAAARASDAFTEFDGHVPAAGKVLDPVASRDRDLADAARRRGRVPVPALSPAWPRRRGHRDAASATATCGSTRCCADRCFTISTRDCSGAAARTTGGRSCRTITTGSSSGSGRCLPTSRSRCRRRPTKCAIARRACSSTTSRSLPRPRPRSIRHARRSASKSSFGRADAVDDEPLAQADPVIIDLGGGLKLRVAGRIDRIDQSRTGDVRDRGLQDRRLLGAQLEGHVCRRHSGCSTRSTVWPRSSCSSGRTRRRASTGAEYYFTSAKGQQERKRIPTPSLASVGAVLGDLRDGDRRPGSSCTPRTRSRASSATTATRAARTRPNAPRPSWPIRIWRRTRSWWRMSKRTTRSRTRPSATASSRISTAICSSRPAPGRARRRSLRSAWRPASRAGAYELERMAAVTFTRKAAAELRGRFQLALEAELAEQGGPGRPSQRRLRAALSNLERFFAGTIHSFCARLLRERPVEAGVSPGFTRAGRCRRSGWCGSRAGATTARRRRPPATSDLVELLDAGITAKQLDKAFETICLHEDVTFPPGDAPMPDGKTAWKALEQFWATLKSLLPAPIDPETTCKTQERARQFRAPVARATSAASATRRCWPIS